MTTISSRLSNTGTLLVNGIFDEVTYNTSTPVIKNLLQYTEQFDNAYWSKTNGATISPDVILAPNGTPTADKIVELNGTNFYGIVSNPSNIPFSTTYTHSIYAKAAERTYLAVSFTVVTNGYCTFDLVGGTVNPGSGAIATITAVGNGWYRCTTTVTTASSGSNLLYNLVSSSLISGTGTLSGVAGYGVYIWGAQLELGNVATDYQPISSAGIVSSNTASKQVPNTIYTSGIFDEITYNSTTPVIKNIVPSYSSQMIAINGWSYGPNLSIISNSTTAPDGTQTAATFNGNGSGANEYILKNITFSANTTYTASVWARLSGGTVPTGGSIISASYTVDTVGTQTRSAVSYSGNLTPYWKRFSTTFTNIAAGTYPAFFLADQNNTANVDVWGAQIELGSVATDYQPIGLANVVLSNTASKITSTGNYYVQNQFDEYTGAPFVDASLVAWYDAAQPVSYPGTGTTWYDLSANKNHASINSSVFYNNTTMSMNFLGGYVQIPSSNSLNVMSTAVTASVWFNASVEDTNFRRIISRDQYPNQNWYIEFSGAPVGNIFGWGTTTGTTNVPITPNTWYNVTMTADATTLSLYTNGVLSFNGTSTGFKANSSPIGIGADCFGGTPFLGNISQVMIYNRILSADEVSQNFNALRRRYNL
ncbi:Concanavalin A-like lectin/glucanases superfamily [uncultured Caudovirales phage]|uniref:Concanavalin A-like lectin/glucanases superfamily n=1 Tax=uncultured Caudovirales phage TaxID=2100421 RepID=A0A6J5LFM8_9CAUD|nr:Concanavalin A-like lectin/glucanases superfamily [uncultured Caudovirales phage]